MCNCNQQRTAYSGGNASGMTGSVQVKLVAPQPLTLSGMYTGRMYVFRNVGDVNWVDKRDLPDMEHRQELVIQYA